jgi:hypothetical protein
MIHIPEALIPACGKTLHSSLDRALAGTGNLVVRRDYHLENESLLRVEGDLTLP